MQKKSICVILVTILFIFYVYHPGRHAKYYNYVLDSSVYKQLVPENFTNAKHNLQFCSYEQNILNGRLLNINKIYESQRFITPLEGGEYRPQDCEPLFKTAILVPYRNRQRQLDLFLNYMHPFLQGQRIHYRLFIVEQNNSLPFNRAKLFNYGATEAMKQGYNCIILHDVDLLPLNSANIYACSKRPRHMSSCLDTFRFNLPYEGLFGGVISITSYQYKSINGMSNLFEGWGGEDDDLYTRLEAFELEPYRFSPSLSKYTMLFHKKEKPGEGRLEKLRNTLQRQKVDGLNTLPLNYVVKKEELFTRLITP